MINSRILSLLPVGRRILIFPNKLSAVNGCSSTTSKIPNYEQKREYKNFGHKREIEPLFTKIFCMILVVCMTGAIVDWRWCRMLFLHYTGQLRDKSELEKEANSTENTT